jgi:YVTN family beta-propeller protein
VKVYRRGSSPSPVATIPVGDLPHGIWPSGDGKRVYVALENGNHAGAIDTLTNKVIANIPIGQTTQALVYVPGAVPSGDGTDNLVPLGEASNTSTSVWRLQEQHCRRHKRQRPSTHWDFSI